MYKLAGAVYYELMTKTEIPTKMVTDKQVAFLTKLCEERPFWAEVENLHADTIPTLTRTAASSFIDAALKIPTQVTPTGTVKKAKKPTVYPKVASGYYAVPSATGNNDLDFYRVDNVAEGKWAGYVFVKRVIGGHPDTPVRGKEGAKALERILEAGEDASRKLYGQEIGRCGICNRHLTDDLSREIGIGPKCRGDVA